MLKIDIKKIASKRETLREKCHEFECKYEEVCESATEYHEGHGHCYSRSLCGQL